MTELEKDRLIEAFMGWKLSWNNEEGKRGWSFYNEESKEYLHKTTYANSIIGFTIDWNWLYGDLDTGEYRIVKKILDFRDTGDFDEYNLAAEFTID